MYSVLYNVTSCFDLKKMAEENRIWLKKFLTFSQINFRPSATLDTYNKCDE